MIGISYNTSWPNDAHFTQMHPGLSESAAIVAKAVKICKNKESEPKNYKELYEFCETLAPPSKNIELFDKMSIIEEDERKKSMME